MMITHPFRAAASRFSLRVLLAIAAAIMLVVMNRESSHPIVHASPTTIDAENRKPGATDWDITSAGDPDIQGFATDISANVGETVHFKITAAQAYTIAVYRLGYYGGAGARRVDTIPASATIAQAQPACLNQMATTGLVDCGNWNESAVWQIPADAVSGIYVAKLQQVGNGHTSHIVFIVRDDSRTADIVFQTSDTTWQAYNQYPGAAIGGASLYCGGPLSNAGSSYLRSCATRAAKVSYNRPFDTRAHDPQSWLFNAEYPMVRWLEANGYDVKYQSGVDTDRRGFDLTGAHKPKTFLSVGHDEYWSGAQRQTVENARSAGVSLAFFSGNEMYWKTRYEPTIDGSGTPYRTLVTYKETIANAKIDPAVDPITHVPIWTGTWRDPRFAATTDGGRPENGLIGQIFTINCCSDRIKIPQEMGSLRLWAHTGVSAVAPGDFYRTPEETLGYEWDEDLDNGSRPAGLIHLSQTTLDEPEKLSDFGANVAPGRATHSLTMYRHNSGAIVFGAGTVQWSWGLDGNHDRGTTPTSHTTDQAMQQATVNLLADMGAQPATLQVGDPQNPVLFAAAKSADQLAPASTIVSPATGSSVSSGVRITITGTSADLGGGTVAGVEVSVDGGTTWKAATGTTLWSFGWTPGVPGSATIKVRAIDDSGNLELAGVGSTVSVAQGECPCTSIWRPSAVPTVPSAADTNAVELGVAFKSDIDGFITGVRFYKGTANNGTHIGNLWTENGAQLATASFTGETTSGWQQVNFSTPVAVTANTVYVASYHTNVGGYAADGAYFATTGVDSPPLHALQSTGQRPNGRFGYGDTQFPLNSFNATNYWVDVVFAPSLSDSTPPDISAIKATTIDSSRVTLTWTTDEPATTRIDYGTDAAILTASIANLPPNTTTVTDANFVTQHGTALTGLHSNTTYYYLITAVDHSGNATTIPAPTFTVPGPTLRDTASADFQAGTSAGGTYVSQTADGELILAPTSATEFTGPDLSPGWTEVPWSPEGYSIIVDGVLLVDGARVASCVVDTNGACLPETTDVTQSAVFTSPHTLEFTANFSGDRFQHAGLGATFASTSEPWAIFSTLNGGLLFARTNSGGFGGNVIDTGLGTGLLGAFHRYKIDWRADSVDYYVDGALVASHNLHINGQMRPVAASDFNPFGGTIFVDWMRMSPYATGGTFYSRIFDADAPVNWNSIQWQATTPAGTSVSIAVRAGNTAVPDATWSDFQPMSSGGPLTLNSQYIQYRAVLATTDDAVTPALEDIIISTGHAPVAHPDSAIVPENGTHLFPYAGPGSLTENDTDADNDLLRVVGVTPASHGTVVLNADGSVRYTPLTNYSGPDAFTYTVGDGLLTSSASVSLDVRFGNVPPVAVNDFYTINEDATLTVPSAIGVLVNDTDVEHDALTAVLTAFPQHGMLTFAADGGFTYVPTPNYAGPDSFRYKANDGGDDSNEATVTLTVNQVNDPPITVDDAYTAVLNQPLDVPAAFSASLGRFVSGVLANDHDVEVEDTTPMHVQLVTSPVHGQLVMSADGGFSYTPEADYLGADTFTYRAVDHFNAQGNVATVTITVAIKAVAASVAGGATVATGSGLVDPNDPLHSAVTSPTAATVLIAQGVISNSQAPAGFTFLNQQVNISVLNADGTDVQASASAPIQMVFNIDRSLVPAGQDEHTFEMFRNGVKIPDCLGQTTIPAANLDPCITGREGGAALNNDIRVTILTSHASKWNMGLSTDTVGDAPIAIPDGPYAVDYGTAMVLSAPGVLGNDIGRSSLTAHLVGTPANGTVNLTPSGAFTFTPDPAACGAASFSYVANDGTTDSAPALVAITIDCKPRPGDDAATVLEDSGVNTISVLANDSDPDPGQTLTVSAVGQPASGVSAVAMSGGAVSYRPNANFFGSDSFTYTVSDGRGGTASATVSVTVKPVNDAPSFTAGANVTVLEDAGPQTAAGWATNLSAGPANEAGQALTFVVTSNNTALFSTQPAVLADGTLTFTPAANANGSATVSVKAHDDGGTADGGVDTSAAQSFTISVTAVNDAPSFTKGADQASAGIVGAQIVPNWATSISAGPADEAGQTLNFIVSSNNSAMFAVQPSVSPDGTLSYTPANIVEGSAIVSVSLHDNGGTANGGVDTSAPQTFTISVSKAATTTTVSSSLNPSQYGQAVTFTATVAVVAPGTGTPSGTVTFMDGATTLGAGALDASGHATVSTSALVAGSHSITAVFGGAALFSGSTSAALAQSVGPRAAAVTPNAASKIYGAADPSFSGTLTGFLASDNVTATYSRTAGETVGGGPYTISATLSPASALSNYTVTYNTAAFTIGKATASVTPNAASKIYGAADPAFSGTLTGFLASDNVTATYSRTAGETVAGGPYTISATLAPASALANYAVTYNTAAFTVAKATASVTPAPASKTYGAVDPAFSGTLSGFSAGDGVTATYSRTAGESVGGSPYAISATLSPASALSNYAVTYNTAAFTIGKATASVAPAPASKTYGAADPAFTGTLSGFQAADGITATYSRTAGESVAGSPYTISATLAPAGALANYTVTYNTAAFTIGKANASVTPAAASKSYGAADPAFTGTLSGFLAADGITATYSRTAGESIAGGPYTISATLAPAAALANYNVTYNTGAFTITKANASVTPAAASKSYGAADPAFTGTLSGFLASDGITATYGRTAGESVGGSPYAISATLAPAAALANYNVTYNTGAFTITKANASVTPAAASKSYGAADPAFTGTLSGFLAADGITAAYSRTAGESVAGSPYAISATLAPAAALANYNVTYNTGAFTITKANASVTPAAASKTYGAADPALTGTLGGFLASDGVTATYSRTAGETVAGGPYTISATLAPAAALVNYNVTYNTGAFTINKALASVTPAAASKIYGAADPAFTGTLTGFRAADGVTATYTRTAGQTVAGSPYAISATLSPAAVLGNYTITSNTAAFTINKAPLTITADNKSRIYGAANPTLTASYTGLVNGDTAASLTTPPTMTTTATATSPIGTYPITPSGAVSGNYTIGYVNGTLTVTVAQSTTAVTSSSNPGLKGVAITLTATVSPVAPSTAIPTGTVTFKDGATTIGTATLAAGVANITTASLAIGTHAITVAYGGSATFGTSTGSLSQSVTASATLAVNFTGHSIADNTRKPKVVDEPIDNAEVRVFLKGDSCAFGIIASGQSRIWGLVYELCTPMAFGTYQTKGTTDASGNVNIIVPPTTTQPNSDFIVIGKAMADLDDGSTIPVYSEHTVTSIVAAQTQRVLLHEIRTFNGKVVPGKDIEEFGSYLGIVQPEYLDWTENEEQYPLILVAEGDWSLTTGVTPPAGFVPDVPQVSTDVADTTSAIQFTMTDVGSDWTQTTVNHSITHLGTLRERSDAIPMTDKKVTTAKNDTFKVMHDSAATAMNVMLNDKVNHVNKPITITGITAALNGTVTVAADQLSVSYTPAPGFSGVDTFTYTITDLIGTRSTATATVTVLDTPAVSVRNTTAAEGNSGQSPATINVVLSNQSLQTVTVNWATVDGSATAGVDYVASSGTVTFVPGDTSEPIIVPIIGDTLAEANEHFTVVLSSPTNATIAAAPGGDITIADDDPPEVSIAPAATITEGNAGTTNIAVAVTLSQTHTESVWVTYKTSDGTATAGSDYVNTTGTLQFYPGTKTQNIYIPVYGDTVGEASEYFYVDISNPVNATLTAATRATMTIVDDDNSTRVFSTTADFAAGTLGAGMYLSETVDGEVTLAPAQAAEFSGAALPAGWTPSVLAAGGAAAVAGGKLAVDGVALVGPAAVSGPQTVEFVATFNASNQDIGFGTSGALVSPMAMFTIRANNLYAKSVNGAKSFETLLSGIDWRGKSHRFQVTTTAGAANYYIDGTLMISHTNMAWGTAAMAPVVIDSTLGDGALSVDWIRMTPFAASGSYTSSVFDAGAAVTWQKLAATSTIVPFFSCCSTAGTTNVITYRTGDTPTPDASWTSFTALGAQGALVGTSRYMQFMVQMTTTNPAKAPAVQDVTVTFKR